MKTQKIESFVKTVSVIFTSYMVVLFALIFILGK